MVGTGHSAGEIAVEVSNVAASVSISTNKGFLCLPKRLNGKPTDHVKRRILQYIPSKWKQFLRVKWAARIIERHERLGIHCPVEAGLPPVMLCENFLDTIEAGSLTLKPLALAVVPDKVTGSYNRIKFDDGTSKQVDAIIFATGYNYDYPFLDPKSFGVSSFTENGRNVLGLHADLYLRKHPTCCFVGLAKNVAPLPVAEMQARYLTQFFLGNTSLSIPPSQQEDEAFWGYKKTHSADQIQYCDRIAKIIGCYPSVWKQPWLIDSLLLGPHNPCFYRS